MFTLFLVIFLLFIKILVPDPCQAFFYFDETVNARPVAKAGQDQQVLIDQKVFFDGSGSYDPDGGSLDFFWEFGDGENADGIKASHQYQKEGDYDVLLKVSDGALDDTDQIKISVFVADKIDSVTNLQASDNQKLTSTTESPAINDTAFKINSKASNGQQKISGIVIVEPGILAKTYFYLSSLDGKQGFQVYCYYADFPILHVGQLVEITGEFSTYYDMTRIKIKNQQDIQVIKGQEPPLPRVVDIKEISDQFLARLIQVQGKILKENGKIFITQEENKLRLVVKSETGISTKSLKEGNCFKITGILDKTRGGLRMLPRWTGDLEQVADFNQEKFVQEKGVLGAQSNQADQSKKIFNQITFSQTEQRLQKNNLNSQKKTIYHYLIATAVALILMLLSLELKKLKNS